VGNRLLATRTAPGASFIYATHTYDAADELLTEDKTQTGVGYSLATFSYDLNGNRILEEKGAQRFTYSWDPANRLTQITHAPNTGKNLASQYRPDGLRSRRTSTGDAGSDNMVWDGSDLLAEFNTALGDVSPFYTRSDRLLKTVDEGTGTTDWQHTDEQGTIVRASGASGAGVPGMLEVGPWGEEPVALFTAGPGNSSWLASPGYFLEPGLTRDLYYVRARWYPAGGPGWLSRDPLVLDAGEVSLYIYAACNPLIYADPSGEAAEFCRFSPGCDGDIRKTVNFWCAQFTKTWELSVLTRINKCIQTTAAAGIQRCNWITTQRRKCLHSFCSGGRGIVQCLTLKEEPRCTVGACATQTVDKPGNPTEPLASNLILCKPSVYDNSVVPTWKPKRLQSNGTTGLAGNSPR
jgi:RHS repeat-associated protein